MQIDLLNFFLKTKLKRISSKLRKTLAFQITILHLSIHRLIMGLCNLEGIPRFIFCIFINSCLLYLLSPILCFMRLPFLEYYSVADF